MKLRILITLFWFGLAELQAQTHFEVIHQYDSTYTRYLGNVDDDIIQLNIRNQNGPHVNNYLLWHNRQTNQTDSINLLQNPQISSTFFLIDFGDTLYIISSIKNNNNILISSLARGSNQPIDRKLIPLGTLHGISGVTTDYLGNPILYGVVDTNYNNLGRGGYPFFIRYDPIQNDITTFYQFERGPFLGFGMPYSLTSLRNGGYAMACDGCKKYTGGPLSFPTSNGYADIAIMNNNFEMLNDTAPVVQSYAGFPFAFPRPRLDGPWRISGLAEFPNGDVVFIGLILDTLQPRFLNQDVIIARWDQQLNKITQFQFGLPNATDYIFQFRHLVIGYDGYIYTAFETNYDDSITQNSTERQKILVTKFDAQLNLIWQETFDSGKHTQFRDMIPTLNGVYLTANQRTGNGPFEKATLLRIKNSSPPVSVNNLVQKYAVDLYPNPATTHAYLNSTLALTGYQLYDLSGKLLVEKRVEPENRIEIETDMLAPGMYIIQPLATEAGKIMEVKRLVKY